MENYLMATSLRSSFQVTESRAAESIPWQLLQGDTSGHTSLGLGGSRSSDRSLGVSLFKSLPEGPDTQLPSLLVNEDVPASNGQLDASESNTAKITLPDDDFHDKSEILKGLPRAVHVDPFIAAIDSAKDAAEPAIHNVASSRPSSAASNTSSLAMQELQQSLREFGVELPNFETLPTPVDVNKVAKNSDRISEPEQPVKQPDNSVNATAIEGMAGITDLTALIFGEAEKTQYDQTQLFLSAVLSDEERTRQQQQASLKTQPHTDDSVASVGASILSDNLNSDVTGETLAQLTMNPIVAAAVSKNTSSTTANSMNATPDRSSIVALAIAKNSAASAQMTSSSPQLKKDLGSVTSSAMYSNSDKYVVQPTIGRSNTSNTLKISKTPISSTTNTDIMQLDKPLSKAPLPSSATVATEQTKTLNEIKSPHPPSTETSTRDKSVVVDTSAIGEAAPSADTTHVPLLTPTEPMQSSTKYEVSASFQSPRQQWKKAHEVSVELRRTPVLDQSPPTNQTVPNTISDKVTTAQRSDVDDESDNIKGILARLAYTRERVDRLLDSSTSPKLDTTLQRSAFSADEAHGISASVSPTTASANVSELQPVNKDHVVHTPGSVPSSAMDHGFSPKSVYTNNDGEGALTNSMLSSPVEKSHGAVVAEYTPGSPPREAMVKGFSTVRPTTDGSFVESKIHQDLLERREGARVPPLELDSPSRESTRVEDNDINLSDFENNQNSATPDAQIRSAMRNTELFGFSNESVKSIGMSSPIRRASKPSVNWSPTVAIPRRDSVLDEIRVLDDTRFTQMRDASSSQSEMSLQEATRATPASNRVSESESVGLDNSRFSLWSVPETVYKDLPPAFPRGETALVSVDRDVIDLGRCRIGVKEATQIAVSNISDHFLECIIAITGSKSISAPEQFLLKPRSSDSLWCQFVPEQPGLHEGYLSINVNVVSPGGEYVGRQRLDAIVTVHGFAEYGYSGSLPQKDKSHLQNHTASTDEGAGIIDEYKQCEPEISESISLLCDRPAVLWCGITPGISSIREVSLKNNGPENSRIQLQISCSATSRLFSLKKNINELDRNLESGQSFTLAVGFSPPSKKGVFRSTLLLHATQIESNGTRTSSEFRIPLVGYSGTSHIEVSSARLGGAELAIGEMGISLGALVPDKTVQVSAVLKNHGSRAAYVRTSVTDENNTPFAAGVASVYPSKLVIRADGSRQIRVSLRLSQSEIDMARNRGSSGLLAIIALHTGDEITRTQLCSSSLNDGQGALKCADFANYFDGEEIVRAESTVEICQGYSDSVRHALFYAGARCLRLGVKGLDVERGQPTQTQPVNTTEASPARSDGTVVIESHSPGETSHWSVSRNRDLENESTVVDSNQSKRSVRPHLSVNTCAVRVKRGRKTEIEVSNHSSSSVWFEAVHPSRHLLSISPGSAVIPPHSSVTLSIEVIELKRGFASSSATHGWRGRLTINCTDEESSYTQKLVVSITVEADCTTDAVVHVPPPTTRNTSLGDSPSVLLSTKNIVFASSLLVGQKARETLKIFNQTFATLTWEVNPVGSTYIKDFHNGDHHVLKHSPFRFSKQRGNVLGHSPKSVAVEFSPRKSGICSQTWSLKLWDATDSTRDAISMDIELRGVASALHRNSGPHGETSSGASGTTGADDEVQGNESHRHAVAGVFVACNVAVFKSTPVRRCRSKKLKICNQSTENVVINFKVEGSAFSISHSSVELKPYSFVRLPVMFSPPVSGKHMGALLTTSSASSSVISTPLHGTAAM